MKNKEGEKVNEEELKTLSSAMPDYWGAECRYRYAKTLALMGKNLKKQMIKHFDKSKLREDLDWDNIAIEIRPDVIAKLANQDEQEMQLIK